MVRSWASGRMTPLEVIAERESVYTLLSQTTPVRLHKNYHQYCINPNTRYPNLNMSCIKPHQVQHLFNGYVDPKEMEEVPIERPAKRPCTLETGLNIDSYSLLRWYQRVLNTGSYGGVHVTDFTSSWRSGLAFCALIDTFRPSLLDCSCLNEQDVAQNNQLAYDTAARELDIAPVMTGEEMAGRIIPDKLTMIVYLTQFYELFKHEPLPPAVTTDISSNRRYSRTNTARSPNRRLSVLSKVGARISTRSKKRKDPDVSGSVLKKIRDDKRPLPPLQASEPMSRNKLPMDEIANRLQQGTAMRPQAGAGFPADGGLCDAANVNVHAMAEVLVAKFLSYADKPVPPPVRHTRMEPKLLAAHTNSELCFFCGKRVYIMERQGAEGVFFHRQCLRCAYCDVSLRINSYFHERRTDGTVRFYCYRHFSRQMRTRPPCKRHLGTSDGEIKGNLPKANVIPASGFDGRQSSLQTAHCGIIASRLSIPGDSLDAPDRTPERIGFEISFDGQESESEERQFDHNLGASTCSNGSLCVSDDDDDDLGLDGESSSGDDIFNSTNDTLSATFTKSLTKEEIVRLSDSWKRQHSVPIGRRCPSDGKDDDDESFDNYVSARCSLGEAGVQSSSEGGDSDDVLTTPYDNSSETLNKGKLFAGSTADSVKDSGPNSASCPAVSSSVRASFFSAPPTVVRLDPSRMFTDRDGTLDLTDIGPAALKTHKQRDTEAGGVEVCLNEVDVGVDDLSSEADHQSERVPLLTVDGSFGDSADDELDSAEEDVMNKETDTSDKRQLLSSGFGDETFVVAVPTTCSVNVGQQQEFVISGSTASFPLVASYDLYDQFGVGSITGSGLLDSVLRSLESLRESSTDDDTCQQVLKDVAVMPEVSSAERNPDRCFKGIDDRFVTDRRRCKKMSFLHPPGTGSAVGSYSDITISASSPSMSSLSSSPDEVVDHSQQAGVCVRRVSSPDCDMKEDCLATMSRVLREDLICEVESFGSTDPCDELCHTLKVNDVGQAVVGKQELSGDKSHVFSGWETLSKMAQSIADPGGAECACEANNGAKHTHMQTTDVPIGGVSPPDNDTSVFFPSSLNVARFCSPPLGKSAANTPAIRTAMAIHEPVLSALSARRRTTRATVIESLDVSLQAKQRADGSDTLKSLIENHLSGTPASVDYYDIVANMSTLDDVYSCMLNKGALTTKASCVEEGPIPFNSFIDHHSSVAVHPRTSVVSDVDDIPYADESEVEERFHTTASSVNSLPKPARLLAASMSVGDGSLVASSAPVNILPVTSVHQIHDVQYADQSCVLRLARDVVQSKTDIRFGDNVIVNPSYRMSAAVSVASPPATAPFGSVAAKLRRRSGAFKHIKPRRPNGLSIDASSNSDLPSEGDDDTADNLETPDGNPLRKNGDIVALLGMKDKETKKSRKSVLPTAPKVKTHKSGASASSRLADDALGCGAGRKMKKHRRSLLSSILNRSDKSGDNLRDMLLESQSSEHVCENLASEISVLKVSPLSTAARTDFTAERYGGHQVSSETVALNVAVTLPAEIAPTAHAEHYLSEAEEPGTTGGHCEVSPIGRPSERGAHKLLRQLRRIEQRRMQTAQEIQRQLEEVDERQRELEDCGIAVEKALRDDDSVAEADEAKLMGEWFSLVREKNGLVRYESELMVRAKELELEDRQSQLQATFHECSMKREKSKDDIDEEGRLLEELLDVVEQRNVLVAMLEDERLRERQQDEDLELTMVDKGYSLSPITMSSPGADISLSDT